MQDRLVVLVTAILAVSIAVVGVLVPLLHTDPTYAVLPFDVSIRTQGTLAVGSDITFLVDVRAHTGLPYPVSSAYLSLDLGSAFVILASDAGENPWHLLNLWNVSGVDFAAMRTYTLNATLTNATTLRIQAMLWTPRGDLASVQIDATGEVNPATISVLGLSSLCVDVTPPGGLSSSSTTGVCPA